MQGVVVGEGGEGEGEEDLVADVTQEMNVVRGIADARLHRYIAQAAVVFHVDLPILAARQAQAANLWNTLGNTCCWTTHQGLSHENP